MKKILLLFTFIVSVFSLWGNPKNEKQLLTEDLEYFQNVVENGYVAYNEPFSPQQVFPSLKKLEKTYQKNLKWRKKNGFPDHFENGINQEALTSTLWDFFFNQTNVKDGHLFIQTDHLFNYVFYRDDFYISDYYFEKQGENFILINSPDKELIGKKYTGNADDLKLTISSGKEIYVFAPILLMSKESEMISLDGKNYVVQIKSYPSNFTDKSVLRIKETDKSLYIRSSSFDYSNTSEEYKTFLNELENVAVLSKQKDFIILDLRHNGGGYTFYPNRLLSAIYETNDPADVFKIENFIKLSEFGSYYLLTSVTAEKQYKDAIVSNLSQDIQDGLISLANNYGSDLKNTKKIYINLDKAPLSSFLQYDASAKSQAKKIIVLMDRHTVSASEFFISYLYMMNKDNVVLVGENTCGNADYGNILFYELPNSKVTLGLAATSYKNCSTFKFINSWKGETRGFYPDYWTPNGHASETVGYLTGDLEMEKILAGLEN